jgi:beta-mannosidase
MAAPLPAIRPSLDATRLDAGWEVAYSGPADPATPPASGLDWIPASVPGTVAGAWRDAGLPVPVELDEHDWWFRTRFDAASAEAGERVVLRFEGIATLAEVWLDDSLVATSESMFVPLELDVTDRVGGTHELTIRCLALAPRLAESRKPRARWRSNLVSDGNLRWFRTSLVGRAPGFSSGPVVVGPWRPVIIERRRAVDVDGVRVRTRLDGDTGVLSVSVDARGLGGVAIDGIDVELDGPSGRHALALNAIAADGATFAGELRIPDVACWWPHTHGTPALHEVRLNVRTTGGSLAVDAGRVGFRTLAAGPGTDHDIERDGLGVHVNGVRVFARGAVWTPVDPIGFAAERDELRVSLELARDAGMNMLRLAGTGVYESADFHDLCDELGILVWQDLMFANLDYPFVDDAFHALVEAELVELLDRLAGRPSSAVVCGNSEVEQQVAMLGLEPALGRDPFYAEDLTGAALAAGSDAVVIPSAPFGGTLPFRAGRGVANYYGVGGYRRPLSDARTAGVRFAAECLAFSNVPDATTVDLDDPAWKTGVPRDRGAEWDFEDVRDHYLASLYGVDPVALRADEPDRYLALSRAVTGEVMASVFGEWRRAGSPCGGGLVLWWRDIVPGAGWGIVDRDGAPKAAYHHLRRALAPVAVWLTDEGLGGVAVHVANDGRDPLVARLRIALYRDGQMAVGEAEERLELPAHGVVDRDVEGVLGRFVDASWAYRFGPPAQDLIVATLEPIDGDAARPLAQAAFFPVGRPATAESVTELGLTAGVVEAAGDRATLELRAERLVHGLRIDVPGFTPSDDAFDLEPGRARRIDLRATAPGTARRIGRLTATNMSGSVEVALA